VLPSLLNPSRSPSKDPSLQSRVPAFPFFCADTRACSLLFGLRKISCHRLLLPSPSFSSFPLRARSFFMLPPPMDLSPAPSPWSLNPLLYSRGRFSCFTGGAFSSRETSFRQHSSFPNYLSFLSFPYSGAVIPRNFSLSEASFSVSF